MKKVLFILMAFVLMAGCTATLPKQISNLADKVEKKGAEFSDAQWEKANATFDKLVKEYNDNIDKFNAEQQKVVNAAIGKYQASALKAGLSKAGSEIENLVEGAKGFLEGLAGDEENKE